MIKELEIGDDAPDFTYAADGGETSLQSFKGAKNIVLYLYPKDDTPGCTIEAKEFRDLKGEFDKTETVIIGLSKDNAKSHDKFIAKFELNFALASNEDTSTIQNYGSWVEKSMYGKKYMGIQRDTFLIDKAGKVAAIWRKVKPEGHAREVLEAAKKLK